MENNWDFTDCHLCCSVPSSRSVTWVSAVSDGGRRTEYFIFHPKSCWLPRSSFQDTSIILFKQRATGAVLRAELKCIIWSHKSSYFCFYPRGAVVRCLPGSHKSTPRLCQRSWSSLCSEQSPNSRWFFLPTSLSQFSLGNPLFSAAEAAVDDCNYGFHRSLTIQGEY